MESEEKRSGVHGVAQSAVVHIPQGKPPRVEEMLPCSPPPVAAPTASRARTSACRSTRRPQEKLTSPAGGHYRTQEFNVDDTFPHLHNQMFLALKLADVFGERRLQMLDFSVPLFSLSTAPRGHFSIKNSLRSDVSDVDSERYAAHTLYMVHTRGRLNQPDIRETSAVLLNKW